jgi:hypothetical protein
MGKLSIPAISAGSVSSNPLSIEVVEASALPAGTSPSQKLAVEVLVDDKPHYVHGEIPITVRITDGTGLTEASLQVPTGNDFTLRQSGADETNQAVRDGQSVTIMQRHYMLTPLKSGELTLPPVVLQGTVPAPANERSMFALPSVPSAFGRSPFGGSLFDRMFNPGQEVRVQSTPVTLNVKANPVSDSNWFLPAKDVQLSAEWTQKNPSFKVGEAVSRTVRLLALGAAREKLPTLEFADADGARIYLDRSDDKSVDTPQGTAAVREFSLSIVPTRAGEITIPAIDVSWWNTEADEQRIASLPAESISVVGGPTDSTTRSNTSIQPAAHATADAGTSQKADTTPSKSAELISNNVLLWSALALIASMTGALLFLRHRHALQQLSSNDAPLPGIRRPRALTGSRDSKHYQQELKRLHSRVVDACKADRAESAYAAYTAWHAMAYPGRNLSSIGLQAQHASFASELDKLETQLYKSSESEVWHGQSFLDAFQVMSAQLDKRSRNKHSIASVPALYPT